MVIRSAAIFFVLCLLTPSVYAQDSGNRVEDLLIWQISENLNLSVKEEKDVSAMIRDLNHAKAERSLRVDNALRKMQEVKNDQEARQVFKEYRAALKEYSDVSLTELDRVQKLLNPQRAVKYFTVKSNLSSRIRTSILTSNNNRPESHGRDHGKLDKPTTLPDPKIIEE